MSEWTQTDWRVGMWSALDAATIGAIFVVVGLIGVAARPPSPEPLQQVDPYLAILEALMILFAVLLVVMMAAVYAYATPERKTPSLAALAFTICFAVTTCGVHFVNNSQLATDPHLQCRSTCLHGTSSLGWRSFSPQVFSGAKRHAEFASA
jgi:uncharacterized membrane protein